jgi:hypothetical protein
MNENPLEQELDRVLAFNGQPITIPVPDNATIHPGDGRHLLDGAVTSWWVD